MATARRLLDSTPVVGSHRGLLVESSLGRPDAPYRAGRLPGPRQDAISCPRTKTGLEVSVQFTRSSGVFHAMVLRCGAPQAPRNTPWRKPPMLHCEPYSPDPTRSTRT